MQDIRIPLFLALALLAIGGVVYLLVASTTLLIVGRLTPGLSLAASTGALLAAVSVGDYYRLGGLFLAQIS